VEAVVFFVAAIGALGGALGVIAMRNPFYSVLFLIVHLFSLAALFLLLTSAFVAAAQVVVYAGAVMVLYVFVVAYVGQGGGESAWEPIPAQRFLAPLLAIALFVELSIAVLGSALKALETHGPDVNNGFGDPAAIGRLLLEKFLLPFEASSILLLLAAVGAIVLAARRREAEA
jgi:NADH-quinone oxidoreductase subunit J